MQKLPIAALIALTATPVLAEKTSYELNGFDQVRVHEGVKVNIVTGGDFDVQAEAHRGALKRLKMRVSGDALVIERKRGMGLLSAGRRDKFEVWVTMPVILAVKSASGSEVQLEGTDLDGLKAQSSSGSSLRITGLSGGAVVLDSSSGSTLQVTGSCDALTAESSSGSSIRAGELLCNSASLDASSGSHLVAYASASASVEASSGSSVKLSGAATLEALETSSGASFSQ